MVGIEPQMRSDNRRADREIQRVRVVIRGAVQGVGFRPFVYRLAGELELAGWIGNSTEGVLIEAEGRTVDLRVFLVRLESDRPPHSFIQGFETSYLDPRGSRGFEIRHSDVQGRKTAVVPPDIATCPECLREIFDPTDRRFGYPFTNCTHCGPRFSIISALPYDRESTSMKGFTLCARCRAEYEDPGDRRFHAQPNACPECGPRVELWDPKGGLMTVRADAIRETVHALREGAIVAVKGLGGFHFMTLASDRDAIERLRRLKHREEKPFAVMFPLIEAARSVCHLDDLEARLLGSSEAPIVLLRRHGEADEVCEAVAPGNPYLGVMLPYTPLHHLLTADLGAPVVATSGNLSDEPICIDEHEAVRRLGGIADALLVHNRPILRHVDDSVARIVLGREMVLRRARGYAPLPITVRRDLVPTLAVGGHLKNTVAFAQGRQVYLSQHIGDLETPEALAAFERVSRDLPALYGGQPEVFAADAHPDYVSARRARANSKRVVCVQHHYAHVLACMAENDVSAPLLGVSWDGTGYGEDETIWGGEFLLVDEEHFERVAHLRAFRLPGGDKAVKEPRRSALGVLYALLGGDAFKLRRLSPLRSFSPAQLKGLSEMLRKGINSPSTSSAGRLFDAVASLVGLRQEVGFEGQAAMDLEFALDRDDSDEHYAVRLLDGEQAASLNGECILVRPRHSDCAALGRPGPRWIVDWAPMIRGVLKDLDYWVPAWEISAKFHNTLAEYIVAVAQRVGERRVVLSGGCFQNRYLLERSVQRLRGEGYSPYWHQRVPTNDGGIALGQTIAANRGLPEQQT